MRKQTCCSSCAASCERSDNKAAKKSAVHALLAVRDPWQASVSARIAHVLASSIVALNIKYLGRLVARGTGFVKATLQPGTQADQPPVQQVQPASNFTSPQPTHGFMRVYKARPTARYVHRLIARVTGSNSTKAHLLSTVHAKFMTTSPPP
eukprot:scaffold103938_cov24-Tisochrysis_lutea.AAC.1